MSPKNKGTHGRGAKPVEEPDEFVQRVNSFGDIIQPHIKKIIVAGCVLMAGLIGWKALDWRHQNKMKDATAAYVSALKVSEAPVLGEGEPAPEEGLHFKSEEERRNASIEAFGKLEKHGDIPLSKLGLSHQAKLLLQAGRFDEALDAYRKFASSKAPEPLRLTALEGIGYTLEAKAMANEDPAARQTGLEAALKAFADLQPTEGGPMRDYSLYHQGRLLVAMGKNDEGIAKYKQVLTERPDSDLVVSIEGRLASLGAE